MADVQELDSLMSHWPLCIANSDDAGRFVRAAKDIQIGECVLAARPAGITLLPHTRKRWCGNCSAFIAGSSRSTLPIGCRACGMHFCSNSCMLTAGESVHSEEVCDIRASINCLSNHELDRECKALAHLLLDMLARRTVEDPPPRPFQVEPSIQKRASHQKSGRSKARGKGSKKPSRRARETREDDPEVMADGEDDSIQAQKVCEEDTIIEEPNSCRVTSDARYAGFAPQDDKDAYKVVRTPTFRSVLSLMTPSPQLAEKFEQGFRLERCSTVARVVDELLREFPNSPLLDGGISASHMADAISKDMCNSFGLWDFFASQIAGYGVFPGASMFNHSCVPNVCHEFYDCPGGGLLVFRALRLIPEGEEIMSYYTDLSKVDSDRRLQSRQWCFDCQCTRCQFNDVKTKEDKQLILEFNQRYVCPCGSIRLQAANDTEGRTSNCTCPIMNRLDI
ncbi:hypothetical protein CYMTET_13446 [Cymbomonas tetramitiformis]|uniref:SET domain-containing protein n=1 Tax=Cymbomonas tetramitiformis TaxID=36881 RepID=A0AAE0GIH5_9CHLO|nr:hypothetical protein CYMTET_13446 [Cymbomonas tetramitiformis]